MPSAWLHHCALLLLGLGLIGGLYSLACVTPLPRPRLGERGLGRKRLIASTGGAAFEPLLRWVAALCAWLPVPRVRARLGRALERAGHPAGMCADEYIALSALASGAAIGAAAALDLPPAWVGIGGAIGTAAPLLKLYEKARLRERLIARRLPAAIDLMALCMGAGLDFTASLRLAAEELGDGDDPLKLELRRMLQQLAMGTTRGQALRAFSLRVPVAAVRDFANAVIQAEQKGNPLSEVLEVQARVLRMRRSVAAEEAAARASVLLLLPLLLLLCCVVLLLFGPFIAGGVGL